MLRGLLHVLPDAHIGHIGVFRNEETLMPETYYCKLPANLGEAEVILIDKDLDRLRFVDQIHKGRIMTSASNRGAAPLRPVTGRLRSDGAG